VYSGNYGTPPTGAGITNITGSTTAGGWGSAEIIAYLGIPAACVVTPTPTPTPTPVASGSTYYCTTTENTGDVYSFTNATNASGCVSGVANTICVYGPAGTSYPAAPIFPCSVTPTPTPTPVPVAPTLTTYYGCCSSGDGAVGQYANSGAAATGLQQYCAQEAGSNLVGGVYTTPQSCNSPTPVAPTPVPVAPTPVPTPVPVAPTPVPVAPTPTPTPVPVAPTPVPVPVNVCAGDISMLNQSQCTSCGYYYSTLYGECLPSNPNTPTPVAPTPVAPTPVAPTPVAPVACNCTRNYCWEACPSCCPQCGC
jgi:hypothetical protein